MHSYYTYITTNAHKRVLYTGVTNDLVRRLEEHRLDARGTKASFAGTYNCCYLIYWELYDYIDDAIAREKEIKGWRRARKVALIEAMNPGWEFLNEEVGCPTIPR